MVWLPAVLVLLGCEDLINWTVINKTDLPIHMYENGRPLAHYRPHEKRESSGGFPKNPEDMPPFYVFKGYEFLPADRGLLRAWIENGKTVYDGGNVRLIFCQTYTPQELDAIKWKITVTQNVPDGTPLDDPAAPCPPS